MPRPPRRSPDPRPLRAKRRRALPARAASVLMALAAACACACTPGARKVADTDSPADVFLHSVLGQDRSPQEYYRTVRDSHDQERFAYKPTPDPFIVDKSIHAVQRLGDADYGRLEGQAQAVDLLVAVLLEDPSPLAQAHAANSMTRMAVKLPAYRTPDDPAGQYAERGDRFLAYLREMDGMFDAEYRRIGGAQSIPRQRQLLQAIGDFQTTNLALAKQMLKPFYRRDYLIDESDPQVRSSIDTALVKRLRALILLALRAAVVSREAYVREEAVRGMETLADADGQEVVLRQFEFETDRRVRAEMVEYFGRIATPEAVAALVPLLEDPDASLRHESRQALARIAGQDLGIRRRTWERWALARYPVLRTQGDLVASRDR